jgi:pimeloyl-ACP methyl ester carboxylesterase
VVEESGATTIVPVTVAHAGWIGTGVRRRLGADRVPKLAFLDWMVLGAPQPFLDALADMSDPTTTSQTVEHVSHIWPAGLDTPAVLAYVESMTAFSDDMWARAAREIADAFAVNASPLAAVAALDDPPPTLHLYAQPADPAFHAAQQAFAADHPWFHFGRLDAASHFPMFEIPDVLSEHLYDFVNGPEA